MASLAQIARGLADQFSTAIGLRFTDYVPDTINPPAGFVNLSEITEVSFGYGSMDVVFDVVVVTAATTARIGQGTLWDYASPVGELSVWVALAANQDLDLGDGTRARIIRYRSLSVEEIAAYRYYGGVFEIAVSTPG